ncbi:MAG: DUF2845 domain-containing protein [Bdellovibrionota bacterium]
MVSLKSLLLVVVLVSMSIPSGAAYADRLGRCDERVLDVGFTQAEVIDRCGEPTSIHRATITRWVSETSHSGSFPEADFPSGPEPNAVGPNGARIQRGLLVSVEVEKWFYNLGKRRFTRTLTFEDGELVKIETGRYGY